MALRSDGTKPRLCTDPLVAGAEIYASGSSISSRATSERRGNGNALVPAVLHSRWTASLSVRLTGQPRARSKLTSCASSSCARSGMPTLAALCTGVAFLAYLETRRDCFGADDATVKSRRRAWRPSASCRRACPGAGAISVPGICCCGCFTRARPSARVGEGGYAAVPQPGHREGADGQSRPRRRSPRHRASMG